MPNLRPQTPSALQRRQLDLIQSMNRDLAASPGAPDAVDGVIQSYELAFRMQDRVPALNVLALDRNMLGERGQDFFSQNGEQVGLAARRPFIGQQYLKPFARDRPVFVC